MAANKEKKYVIKTNKKHKGKEFNSYFRFIGQVSPVQKQDKDTQSWEDQPLYEQKKTRTDKWRRTLSFNIETAKGNRLKVETAGMELQYAYAYSRKHEKTIKIKWADRTDRTKWNDENGVVTSIDDTFHLMDNDWDQTLVLSQKVKGGDWVEVKGHYEPNEFKTDDGDDINTVKRIITSITPIVEGNLQVEGEEPKVIKIGENEIKYVTDLNSPDFIEVNHFNMQVGIRSTYQDTKTKDTKVNGIFLTYGKTRSEPKDVELMVYFKEPDEGKKSLAEAFASLNTGDFIEATGQDNNRATFTYVEIEDTIKNDDPFSEVDESQKTKRMQRVTNGDKKGLEVTGFVGPSLMRSLLTEEDMRKTVETTSVAPFIVDETKDPFEQAETSSKDPFDD